MFGGVGPDPGRIYFWNVYCFQNIFNYVPANLLTCLKITFCLFLCLEFHKKSVQLPHLKLHCQNSLCKYNIIGRICKRAINYI